MLEKLNLKNVYAVPRLEKIIVSIGAGKAGGDVKILDEMANDLKLICGQAPVKKQARKSIANFKVREGMVVGLNATLRGRRMYDFFDKLINITLPRVRDFRGIKESAFDGHGNITVGIKEHTVFPEIKVDQVENIHGLEVTIVTTAKNNEQAKELLRAFNFPFAPLEIRFEKH